MLLLGFSDARNSLVCVLQCVVEWGVAEWVAERASCALSLGFPGARGAAGVCIAVYCRVLQSVAWCVTCTCVWRYSLMSRWWGVLIEYVMMRTFILSLCDACICVMWLVHMFDYLMSRQWCVWTASWVWTVGSLKWLVSFAEYSLCYRALLQKRPIQWWCRVYWLSATHPYVWSDSSMCVAWLFDVSAVVCMNRRCNDAAMCIDWLSLTHRYAMMMPCVLTLYDVTLLCVLMSRQWCVWTWNVMMLYHAYWLSLTHIYAWRDSFTCVTWLLRGSTMCVAWLFWCLSSGVYWWDICTGDVMYIASFFLSFFWCLGSVVYWCDM